MAFLIQIFIFLGILVNFLHPSQCGKLVLMRISSHRSLLLRKTLKCWIFLWTLGCNRCRVFKSGVPLVCANCRCLLESIKILMHAGVLAGVFRSGNMHQPYIWNWTTTIPRTWDRNIKLQSWTWCVALKLIQIYTFYALGSRIWFLQKNRAERLFMYNCSRVVMGLENF